MNITQKTLVGFNSDVIIKTQNWQCARMVGILHDVEQQKGQDINFGALPLTFF